jgi:hypothetical protein
VGNAEKIGESGRRRAAVAVSPTDRDIAIGSFIIEARARNSSNFSNP